MNEVINEFGHEWQVTFATSDNMLSVLKLYSKDAGEVYITHKAFDLLKCVSDSEQYKIPALIFEQLLYGKVYSISTKDEIVKWNGYKYISVSIDNFLNRFPSNILEKQHRALLLLQNNYPEYGQRITHIHQYLFFAKNENEWKFIYTSMAKKKWVNAAVDEIGSKDPFFVPYIITAEGWIEIEKLIKYRTRRQIFIAMKFKNMHSVYDAIYNAIDDAKFIPLRIDKKEHINQISNEIQYEITQSGLVVADVTGQNQGVYFEAGYAMGLNIPVIWTCNIEEEKVVHFDIRQYNTIFWKDENDLRERLKKRITAVMGLQEK